MAEKKNCVAWVEIPVLDMERALKFYESILAIEIDVHEMGPLTMGIFPHAEVGCALCYHPDFYHPGQKGTLVYLDANSDLQLV